MAEEFVKRGFDVVSGGTDNHLFLLSLINQGLTGKDADAALEQGAYHRQQELGTQRSAIAVCYLGAAYRLASDNHAWFQRTGFS